MNALRIAFSARVEADIGCDGDLIRVRIDDEAVEMDRETADRLRSTIGDALAGRRTSLRTAGEHRPDGSYVVSRRGADSAGNRTVFESFSKLRGLYERLPRRADAAAVAAAGTAITGSRRHLVLRHLTEHPAFDCGLVSRSPLVVERRDGEPRAGEENGSRDG